MFSIDIFCNVIDNFGDAGVCLHLARNFTRLQHPVQLFCNNLSVLEQITTAQDKSDNYLSIKSWEQPLTSYTCPQVVINAFNCRLDEPVMQSIREAKAVVINLEYLSAEEWTKDFHGLSSPADGLNCYYFFPGFTEQTGGLNVDDTFVTACKQHLLALDATPSQLKSINLFSYQNDSLKELFENVIHGEKEVKLNIFTGLGLDNFNTLYQKQLKIGDHDTLGSLDITVSPMLDHYHFDDSLLNHDVNLVRGEDSIVRAMHTGNPFLWQIYVQEENVHIEKLNAFLELMSKVLLEEINPRAKSPENPLNYTFIEEEELKQTLAYMKNCMLAYNNAGTWPKDFKLDDFVLKTRKIYVNFAKYLCNQPKLYSRLLSFMESKLQA